MRHNFGKHKKVNFYNKKCGTSEIGADLNCTLEDPDTGFTRAVQAFTKTSEEQKENNFSQAVVGYSVNKQCLTGREIMDEALSALSDTISRCLFTEEQKLILFKESMRMFLLISGRKKFSSFLVKLPLVIDSEKDCYDLPDNADTIINLYMTKECRDCCVKERTSHVRFNYVPFESWSENNRAYSYTVQGGNKIYLSRPLINQCLCYQPSPGKGHLFLEYYRMPSVRNIEDLDTKLCWFPRFEAAYGYLYELIKENIVAMTPKGIYRSPYKESYRRVLMEHVNGDRIVDTRQKVGRKPFLFR